MSVCGCVRACMCVCGVVYHAQSYFIVRRRVHAMCMVDCGMLYCIKYIHTRMMHSMYIFSSNWKWEPESIDTMRLVSSQKKILLYLSMLSIHRNIQTLYTITDGKNERDMVLVNDRERNGNRIVHQYKFIPSAQIASIAAAAAGCSYYYFTVAVGAVAVPINVHTISM